jgi:hypothetical protein
MSRVLLATIKNLGQRPCPRCLILKKDIPDVGTPRDTQRRQRFRSDNKRKRQDVEDARKLIYQEGRLIQHKKVQDILGKQSTVPTRVG